MEPLFWYWIFFITYQYLLGVCKGYIFLIVDFPPFWSIPIFITDADKLSVYSVWLMPLQKSGFICPHELSLSLGGKFSRRLELRFARHQSSVCVESCLSYSNFLFVDVPSLSCDLPAFFYIPALLFPTSFTQIIL